MGPRQKKSSEGADNSVHNGKAFTPINGKLNRKAGLFNSLKVTFTFVKFLFCQEIFFKKMVMEVKFDL